MCDVPSASPPSLRRGARSAGILGLAILLLTPVPLLALDGPTYRVAVIDVFAPDATPRNAAADQNELIADDAFDLDADGLRDPIYHGDLVCTFLRGGRIETVAFPVPGRGDVKSDLLARLREIDVRKRAGDAIDAVMFCWESSTLVSAFGDTLRECDRERYRETIRAWGQTSDDWRRTYEIILALEQLARDGVNVVTIAGNSGRAWVNTYTFARDVMVVGAIEADPDGEWATSNSLITTRARSVYTVRLVTDADRPAFGYDVDGDGVRDFSVLPGSSYLQGHGALRDGQRVLKGTSFAAPAALREMVAQRSGR